MALASTDFEQAGELKIGQVGIANLRVRTMNVPLLIQEMQDRVNRAPKLFNRAALIIDFGGLPSVPDAESAKALLAGMRQIGVLPVALAYGTRDAAALAEQLGLPVLAKFRAQYERVEAAAPARSIADAAPEPTPHASAPTPAPAKKQSNPASACATGMIHKGNVRSGQQLYAKGSDLTILGAVSPGAEVIADGSIHVYGNLRGRALAGANGENGARIFCHSFEAELVAIAGHYKVLDDIPDTLRGNPAQVWLEQGQIKLALLE